jgi:hypothetical protein
MILSDRRQRRVGRNTPPLDAERTGQVERGAANPGGRPVSAAAELRARYSRRLPELFDDLLEMATNSQNPMVRLGAIRLALDHLLGRPQVTIDAQVAKFDVGAAYLQALRRAYPNGSPVIDGDDGNSNSDGAANKIQ